MIVMWIAVLMLVVPSPRIPSVVRLQAAGPGTAQDSLRDGRERFEKGDYEGAIRALTTAIERDPSSVPAHYIRALAHHLRREYDRAVEDFSRAVTLNPRFSEGYHNRGVSRACLGDLQSAIADFTEALKIAPGYREAYLNRGSARARMKDLDGAIADYSALLAIDPRDVRAYYNRGVIKASKGDHQGAVADYDRAIEQQPDFAEAYLNRGVARERLEDLVRADADCSRAIEINSRYASAFYNRGVIRGRAGNREGATADYSRALELDPRHGQAVAMRARLYYDSQSWVKSLEDLRKLCELSPADQAPYRLRIWLVRSRMGEKQAATRELEDFVAAQKNGAQEPWSKLAAEFLLGRVSEGKLVEGAVTIDPARATHRSGEAWFFSGTRRLLEGDWEGARDCFLNCLARGAPESAACRSASAELDLLGD